MKKILFLGLVLFGMNSCSDYQELVADTYIGNDNDHLELLTLSHDIIIDNDKVGTSTLNITAKEIQTAVDGTQSALIYPDQEYIAEYKTDIQVPVGVKQLSQQIKFSNELIHIRSLTLYVEGQQVHAATNLAIMPIYCTTVGGRTIETNRAVILLNLELFQGKNISLVLEATRDRSSRSSVVYAFTKISKKTSERLSSATFELNPAQTTVYQKPFVVGYREDKKD